MAQDQKERSDYVRSLSKVKTTAIDRDKKSTPQTTASLSNQFQSSSLAAIKREPEQIKVQLTERPV